MRLMEHNRCSRTLSFLFFFILSGAPAWADASLFLRSEIQKLNEPDLARLSFEHPKLSWFFLAEKSVLDGELEGFERYDKLLNRACENPQLDGNNSLICALYFGVNSGHASPVQSIKYAEKFFRHFKDANDFGVGNEDRLYVEGRVFYKLPLVAGRNVGKSLVAFQILRRLKPQFSFDYWIADIYTISRRNNKAREYRKKARAAGSVRLEKFRQQEDSVWEPEKRMTFTPGLFYTPQTGYGVLGQLELPLVDQVLASKMSLSVTENADWETDIYLRAHWGVLGGKHRFAASEVPDEPGQQAPTTRRLAELSLFTFQGRRFFAAFGGRLRTEGERALLGPSVTVGGGYDEYPFRAQLTQRFWAPVQGGLQSLTQANVTYDLNKRSQLEAMALGLLEFSDSAPFLMGWDVVGTLFPRVSSKSTEAFTSLKYANRVWLGLELSAFGLHRWSEGQLGAGVGVGWLTRREDRVGLNIVRFGGRTYLQTQSRFQL